MQSLKELKQCSLFSGIQRAPAMKSPPDIIEPIEQADMCDRDQLCDHHLGYKCHFIFLGLDDIIFSSFVQCFEYKLYE